MHGVLPAFAAAVRTRRWWRRRRSGRTFGSTSTTAVAAVRSTETVSPGARAMLSRPFLAAWMLTAMRTGSGAFGSWRITSTSSANGIRNAAGQGQGVEHAYFLVGRIGEFARLADQSDHVDRRQRALRHVDHVAVAEFGHLDGAGRGGRKIHRDDGRASPRRARLLVGSQRSGGVGAAGHWRRGRCRRRPPAASRCGGFPPPCRPLCSTPRRQPGPPSANVDPRGSSCVPGLLTAPTTVTLRVRHCFMVTVMQGLRNTPRAMLSALIACSACSTSMPAHAHSCPPAEPRPSRRRPRGPASWWWSAWCSR